ncbi:MAG TPA: hypothetical protein PLU80_07765 [Acidobacteriota bacterium]|nr:hypothetical protein [Acidobacteriota bacterium]
MLNHQNFSQISAKTEEAPDLKKWFGIGFVFTNLMALPVFGKHGELTNWYQAGCDFMVGWSQTGFSGRSGKVFDPLR